MVKWVKISRIWDIFLLGIREMAKVFTTFHHFFPYILSSQYINSGEECGEVGEVPFIYLFIQPTVFSNTLINNKTYLL